MEQISRLNELREQGRMTWAEGEHAMIAEPEQILNALLDQGFQECKQEVTRSRRNHAVTGPHLEGNSALAIVDSTLG